MYNLFIVYYPNTGPTPGHSVALSSLLACTGGYLTARAGVPIAQEFCVG